ncbi:MAG: hypothetical protein ABI689_13195 [Thermoanaerobaculia bacterium]
MTVNGIERRFFDYLERGVPYGPDDLWRTMRCCPYLASGLRRAGFSGGWL